MPKIKREYALVVAVLVLLMVLIVGQARLSVAEENGEGLSTEQQELKARLTEMQYKVTQEDGTEPPFRNEYWDHKEPGLYVDIVSGEPLFSSLEKFDSDTGWPSFTQPISESAVVLGEDNKLGYTRVEVRSSGADSHLGHLFNDGPPPSNNRYCINSAALRFVSVEELEAEGYGEYVGMFEDL